MEQISRLQDEMKVIEAAATPVWESEKQEPE